MKRHSRALRSTGVDHAQLSEVDDFKESSVPNLALMEDAEDASRNAWSPRGTFVLLKLKLFS